MSSFNQSTNQELRIEKFSPFGGFATWILSVKRLSFRFEYPFDDGLTGLFGAVATFAEYSTNANVLAVAAGQPIQPWKLPENIKPPLQTGVESAAELKQFDRNMADWDRRSKMITAIRLDYRNFLSDMLSCIPKHNRSVGQLFAMLSNLLTMFNHLSLNICNSIVEKVELRYARKFAVCSIRNAEKLVTTMKYAQ